MKKNKGKILSRNHIFYIILFVCVSLISIGYSALNTTLSISGTATARAKSDIRVTGIKSTRLEYGAYEKTSPKYTKYTTQMESTLPESASIIEYTVTIKNYSDKQYELISIETLEESNPDIMLSIEGLAEGKIFEPGEEVTFVLKEMYTTGMTESSDSTTILKYNFEEYVPVIENQLLKDRILADNGGTESIEAKGTPTFTAVETSDVGMYKDTDDKGSTYYFRGAVTNNYVLFAGYYWRIVRINGDNSIKLIYQGATADASGTASGIGTNRYNSVSGYQTSVTYYRTGILASASEISTKLEEWYSSNLVNYDEYIYKDSIFFADQSYSTNIFSAPSTSNSSLSNTATATYFGARHRLTSTKQPTFLIQNDAKHTSNASTVGDKNLTYPIGFITLDEAYYAGGFSADNTSYYLYSGTDYWTMSPYIVERTALFSKTYNAKLAIVNSSGQITTGNSDTAYTMRPVINLIPEVNWASGTGTADNPYIPTLGNSETEVKIDPTPYYNSTLATAITSMSDAGDTSILKHTSSLENSAADDNYRYSGSDPDNYVCFGDSSYTGADGSTCATNNLYRILGVFDGKVKLITADYVTTDMAGSSDAYRSSATSLDSTYTGKRSASDIALYAYTLAADSNATTASNDWNEASALAATNLNSIFYNSFSSDWKSKIVKTTWHVGDVSYFDAIKEKAKLVMDREIGSDATYENYIGMMYYYEYAFAAQPKVWKYSMNSYANYTDKNWMFLGSKEWTISHGSYTILLSKITTYAAAILTTGAPGYERVNNGLPIRATFSIDSSVKLSSGKGTYENPFVLDVS